MTLYKNSRVESLYMSLAAEFLEREAVGGHGLITATGVRVSRDGKNVTVLYTVLPDKFEKQAETFTRRIRSDFREHVKAKTKYMAFCPTFDFALDLGEKHRQRIDSLIQQT